MLWRCLSFLVVGTFFAICAACSRDETVNIDTSKTEVIKQTGPHHEGCVRIALGGMITPKEGVAYYREFLEFIEKRIGRHVEYVDAEDYREINRMLKSGELEAAFVCSGPFVDGKKDFGLEFIAAPQAYGKAVYYSYFIVPAKATARKLEDLRGKTFAFSDPLSNSGTIVPTYMLAQMGETPEHFFGKTWFSGSHDKSIQAVSEGLVDGAAVDSLIWEYKRHVHPEEIAKTRVIYRSAPYAPPPFVVRPDLDKNLKGRLRDVMVNAHHIPEGRRVLDKMMIDRFVVLDDRAYDPVRQIKQWIESKGLTGPAPPQ